jgi:Rps23 Pro-64 3,4-dihydroxylase Tpa1-like proline 4-hydroxylase
MWQLGLDWRDETSLASQWRAATPFPHLIFDDFVADGLMDILDDEHVDRYEGDLFAFEASRPGGMREIREEFAAVLGPALARITGKPIASADMRAYAYRPGHYLLPHSDHQDGLDRVLAYAYYLPTPEPPRGGELELFRCELAAGAIVATESATLIEPRPHRLVVFDVSDVSLHQVREVLAGLRISLAGWFYA